jgi:ABC-type phosphate/phosphonate transport system substrate-binding protein
MKAYRRLGVAILVVAAGLAGLVPAPKAAGEEMMRTSPVRIGLVATLFRDTPDTLVHAIMRPFKSLMESQTGLSGNLVPGIPPADLAQQLKDDKVQLGVFHGFEFAWARQKYSDLKPLMIAINKQRHLRAHLIVRDDVPAASFADLQGKSLAIPRRTREHCRLFLERRCEAGGRPAKEYFGKIVVPATAEEAVDDVASGTVQTVLVDGVFLDWYRQNKPSRFARLKTVQQSEVFPPTVVAYYANALDEATLQRFREGMIAAKDNPRSRQLMSFCQITAFEPIPEDYEQLLTTIAKAYPPSKDK